ncbi:MAG: hypothetical protein HY516_00595 [Candidatus Aenigmarchaeota archaeon]|nr:hypothetical protein [Candidatus Aenigmarchaeota archaeon]
MANSKGASQDTIFLILGLVIFVMTAFVVYMLIGGPYCDDMAKKTANNIKTAVETVSKTGTYTEESPYTTYVMLCQNKVGSPLTLNPFAYKAFTTPEYMIYWEHFPEGPGNIGEGLYKFDESYPFSKNMALILASNVGLSLFSGTLSTISKTKIGGAVKDFSSKISQSAAGKVAKVFLGPVVITAKAAAMPFKIINYMSEIAIKGTVNSVKFVVAKSGIGKLITQKEAPNIFGKVVGLGFLKSMADNGLVEFEKVAAADGADDLAIKMVSVTDPSGKTYQKAVVPPAKRPELEKTINDLLASSVDEEKIMGQNLKEFFAYSADEISSPTLVGFRKIIQESEGAGEKLGFNALVGGSMTAASKSFDDASRAMASRYGLYAQRPITTFFDHTGITRFSKKVNALDVFRKMKFFDDAGNPAPIIGDISKRFKDLKITTTLDDPNKFAAATEKFFVSDGKAIIAGAETDTAMMTFLESSVKEAKDGIGTGVKAGAYKKFMDGAATDDEIESIAGAFKSSYLQELKASGVSDATVASVESKLSTPQYSRRLVADFQNELKNAKNIRIDPSDPASALIDRDEAMEIAMLSASWKREPETLALMAEDKYDSILSGTVDKLGGWEPKETVKFLKTDLSAFTIGTYLPSENDVKYSYLKSPNAGCESNTVCLNMKTVEQKKEGVSESQIKSYEDVYVVKNNVMVRLKRDGFISPLGGGVGAFQFDDKPRFHLVSPCLAQISFYNAGDDKAGRPLVMADVDKCPTPGHSNYCYFDEGKFNEMAAGFYGSLACSVIADFGKLVAVGFLLQPACSGIQVKTEYDTTWPFQPFQSLGNKDMNVLNCNIQKNPKEAAKLSMTACCGIAQCTGDFVCQGVDYAEKNRLICGSDSCTLEQLAKVAESDYKNVCGCNG